MAIYIDANWAAPTNSSVAGFWLDMSPSDTTGASYYPAENDFAFFTSGAGSVSVSALNGNGPTLTSITSSGWYTFQIAYSKGPTYIDETLSVIDSSNSVIGSTTMTMGPSAIFPSGALSSNLGGNGYAWLTLWQNGFASDHLAIDNLRTSTVPLPSAAWGGFALLGGLGLLAGVKRMRKPVV